MPAEASPSHLHVPELGSPGTTIALSEAESHYLLHVCRARVGDLARATDGRGTLAELRVVAIGKTVRAAIESVDHQVLERSAWLLCGAPEGQRADWLVEKLAELGVAVWQPLLCARGEWHGRSGRGERWERLAVAAMRQSRRRFLMEVREPLSPRAALAALPSESSRWIASVEGERGVPAPRGPGVWVGAVGPAPGFTPAERQDLEEAGFRPLCLADGRLRTETAALAWAMWWCFGS